MSGTGTKTDPYVLDVDPATIGIGSAITTADSNTIKFTKTGSGGAGDPVILSGRVILLSPNNTSYTLAVSNTGVLSAVASS